MLKRNFFRMFMTLTAMGVFFAQAAMPLSAAAPSEGPSPALRRLVFVEGLEYGPFVRGCVVPEVCNSRASLMHDHLLISEATGTLRSDDIPALNGGTIVVRQAFQFMIDLQSLSDIKDGTTNTIVGRTAGEATLAFQDGDDLLLRFKGHFRATIRGFGEQDTFNLDLRVDAHGGEPSKGITFDDSSGQETLKSLALDLAGQFDLGSREITSLGGGGTLQVTINGSGFGG